MPNAFEEDSLERLEHAAVWWRIQQHWMNTARYCDARFGLSLTEAFENLFEDLGATPPETEADKLRYYQATTDALDVIIGAVKEERGGLE